MNWLGQVRHVAAKDVRQTRWLLLGYVAIVALTTRDAAWLLVPRRGSPEGLVLLVVACGMFVVAALVQADSPTRGDAFWASKPLDASAVFAAKLVVTGAIVIGVPIVGQLAALLAIGTSAERLPLLLLVAAWSYALWLLAAMLVAALTKDLRTFATVFIGICVVLLFAMSELVPSHQYSVGQRAQAFLTYGGAAVALAAVFTLYRTRDTRPRMWAVGIVATIVILIGSTISSSPGLVVSTASAEAATPRRNATLTAELVDASAATLPAQWRFHVRATGATATKRFSLSVTAADVYLRTGSVLRLPASTGRAFPRPPVRRRWCSRAGRPFQHVATR